MFDKEAITALQEGESISAAASAVAQASITDLPAALPSDYKLHDLERYLPNRRRARGTMTTRFITPFAEYACKHTETGATVFVHPDHMTATAVLDLGTLALPGHADHLAKLQPSKTSGYAALHAMVQAPRTQQEVAEFLEDWADDLHCFNADGAIKPHLAIAAVRKITIDSMRKVESEEQSLGATRSAFESVQASSKDPLPTTIHFTCQPYADLNERTFVLRLGVLTGDSRPKLTLRVQKLQQHEEEMAEELAQRIEAAIELATVNAEAPMQVLVGQYSKSD